MAQNSTLPSTRRRTSTRSASKEEENNEPLPPSRIPIKSPARSSSSNSINILGGMAVAYSPIKSSPSSVKTTPSLSGDYAKKLSELKNAMDLLKTPPAPQPQAAQGKHNQSNSNSHTQAHSQSQSLNHHISYTPLRSSSLALPNDSMSLENDSNQMDLALSSDSDTLELTGNDTSLLEAYNDDNEVNSSPFTLSNNNNNNNKRNNFYSSPAAYSVNTVSSPYMSSDELKKRLEATKEAFQRSLEAQKRRLRTSFEDIDSSFSTCSNVFDSDLSIDSLNDTKEQLERIRREVTELIESDMEDVTLLRSKRSDFGDNLMLSPPVESLTFTLLRYSLIFSICSIIFTYLFINHGPAILESLENVNILEKFEETLNFLLQDN